MSCTEKRQERNHGVSAVFISLIVAALALFYTRTPLCESLDVPNFEQEHSEWCWAAVSAAVIGLYTDNPPSQCDIAAWVMTAEGRTDDAGECCDMGDGYFSDHRCNDPNELYDSPGSVSDVLTAYDIPHVVLEGPLSFDEIVDAIDDKRPFVIHWAMTPGLGHFVLGFGYDETAEERVQFINPSPDESRRESTYRWMVSGTNTACVTHYWAHTLLLSESARAEITEDAGIPPSTDRCDETELNDVEIGATSNGRCDIIGVAAHHHSLLRFVRSLVF